MPAPRIAEVVFSDPDTVRDVIHNFNRDGFEALYPRYKGGRPRRFTLPERQQIKRIALSVPSDLGQPFATWSLAKLADYLVAEEVVTDISHEGLRQLLREEGVSFQALRTWKRSNDPDYEAKKNRILELYAIADVLGRRQRGVFEVAPRFEQPLLRLFENARSRMRIDRHWWRLHAHQSELGVEAPREAHGDVQGWQLRVGSIRGRHDDFVHASYLGAWCVGRGWSTAPTSATGDATCTIRGIYLSNIRCQDTPSHHQSVIAARESAGFERQCLAPTMGSSPPPV
jgi:transposase